ncbi:hypothetical protein SDRG_06336 [Saprolegnia diclina VS20]|uniref:DUF4349 domain-containing protein n=1 Tax=Saprolegnia diclina (strain VS20) TaxID=1156394 RepID=T0QE99_SAPDV|nr:hypothetical protein SDRG_06336 [Saprolegnia diclina VS20]EQC36229.1 hypothetical protein SDRG_06336 [Saprolegnia diclina VS20]|eukprot:XP_008610335.1 hypothetical protein SDRG_06336 [Saprolegnia diclina VS20]
MALRQRRSPSSTTTGETDTPSSSSPPPRPAPPASAFMKIATSVFALIFLASCVHGVLPTTTLIGIGDTTTDSPVRLTSGASFPSGSRRISNEAGTLAWASGQSASPSASSESEMLIWTADMTLRAKHGSGAWDAARAHIQSHLLLHGFLEDESESADRSEYRLYSANVRCVSRSTNATIPCPQDVYLENHEPPARLRTWHFTWRVEAFHDRLRALEGVPDVVPNTTVASKRVTRFDASAEYMDASGRSATLRLTRAALEKLLEQATNVQEIASIVTQVQDVTEKIEAAESKLLRTSTSVRLSKISVDLEEHDADARVVVVDDRAPPSKSRWAAAYERAVGVLQLCGNLAIDGIMLALVVGTPMTIVLWLGWKLFARLRQSDDRYNRLA